MRKYAFQIYSIHVFHLYIITSVLIISIALVMMLANTREYVNQLGDSEKKILDL